MARAASSLTAELNARVAADGVLVRGTVTAEYAEILTPEALRFLAKLHRSGSGVGGRRGRREAG